MTPSPPELDLQKFLIEERHAIHLIGVAGSGMSGIAALLLELGHDVRGSDKARTLETERLAQLGLRFSTPHRAEDTDGVELIIFSSAIKEDNSILADARLRSIPAIRRAEALAAMMLGKRGIIIAGMHGKTTTAAMTAHVLRGGGLHPSHYVGAEIPILGSNAHWDSRGEFFVVEGDESDGTLQLFQPEYQPSYLTSKKSISISTRTWQRSKKSFGSCWPGPQTRFSFAPTIRTPGEFAKRTSGRFPMASARLHGIAQPALSCMILPPSSACNAATRNWATPL